jgi:tetratricopeptide (TPR) repeat protein
MSLAVRSVMDHLNGRLTEAAQGYLAAFESGDAKAQGLALYGAALLAFQQNQLIESVRCLRLVTEKYAKLFPGAWYVPSAWYNRGLLFQLLSEPEESLRSLDTALQLDPNLVEAHNQRGISLLDLGRPEEAIEAFNRAITLRGKGSEARFNRAVSLLLTGHWEEGWAEYESRHEITFLPKPFIPLGIPKWDGRPLEGKHILLWCEQGLGDTIMCLRFIPELIAQGTVTAIVPKALQRLCLEAVPRTAFITSGDMIPRADYQISFMSLPHLLKSTPDSAWTGAYL